jgi:hypothetical protein
VLKAERKRVFVPIGFDPAKAWGPRSKFYVAGTVNGMGVRGVVEDFAGEPGILLGPAWRRDCGLGAGDRVDVTMAPEGLQREDLPADIASALAADTVAGDFFDSMAPFYRNDFLTRIEATKPQCRDPLATDRRDGQVVEGG